VDSDLILAEHTIRDFYAIRLHGLFVIINDCMQIQLIIYVSCTRGFRINVLAQNEIATFLIFLF
jgi:hypothetical protein